MFELPPFVRAWLFDPLVGKIVTVLIGIIVINILVRLSRRTLLPRIEGIDTRYRFRKLIGFTVRYVVDFKKRRSTKDILFTNILDAFQATSGAVSIASSTFHLVDAPVLNVRFPEEKVFGANIPK